MANFMRRHVNPSGTYFCAYKVEDDENGVAKITKEIKIEGREIFSTDDKKMIEFLRNDPEIVEVDKKTMIETVIDKVRE